MIPVTKNKILQENIEVCYNTEHATNSSHFTIPEKDILSFPVNIPFISLNSSVTQLFSFQLTDEWTELKVGGHKN